MTTHNVGKAVKKEEISYIAGVTVYWWSLAVSMKLQMHVPYASTVTLSGILQGQNNTQFAHYSTDYNGKGLRTNV